MVFEGFLKIGRREIAVSGERLRSKKAVFCKNVFFLGDFPPICNTFVTPYLLNYKKYAIYGRF